VVHDGEKGLHSLREGRQGTGVRRREGAGVGRKGLFRGVFPAEKAGQSGQNQGGQGKNQQMHS